MAYHLKSNDCANKLIFYRRIRLYTEQIFLINFLKIYIGAAPISEVIVYDAIGAFRRLTNEDKTKKIIQCKRAYPDLTACEILLL